MVYLLRAGDTSTEANAVKSFQNAVHQHQIVDLAVMSRQSSKPSTKLKASTQKPNVAAVLPLRASNHPKRAARLIMQLRVSGRNEGVSIQRGWTKAVPGTQWPRCSIVDVRPFLADRCLIETRDRHGEAIAR